MVEVNGSSFDVGSVASDRSKWPLYAALLGGGVGLVFFLTRMARGGSSNAQATGQPSTTAFLQSIGEQVLQLRGDESLAHADELTRDRQLMSTTVGGITTGTQQNRDILDYLNSMAASGLISDNRLRSLLTVVANDVAARQQAIANLVGQQSGLGSPNLDQLVGQNTQQVIQLDTNYTTSGVATSDMNDPTLSQGSGSEFQAARSATSPSYAASEWLGLKPTAFV